MISFLKKYQDHFGLLILWLLIILIINPIGDFPLNDDWCYGKSVKTLLEDGYLKLYNWGEMTLVGHVYWGYFFTKIFGFSFTVLRWSTLVMAFGTLIGIYELCKLANISRWVTLVSVLLCMMNPIFLSLSFSFMTDVPFYFVTIWAFYFFAKALQTDTWKPIIWGIFFCYWAFTIRQLAWVFPIVYLITMLLAKKRTRSNFIKAITPLLALLVFSMVFSYIMETNDLLQDRYNSKFNLMIDNILHLDKVIIINSISYFCRSMSYLGFLLLPIHLIYFSRYKFKGYKILAIIWTVLVATFLLKLGKQIPSLDNIWIDFGVGPTTLAHHAGNFTTSPDPRAPKLFWQIITIIGVFSSVTLVFHSKRLAVAVFKKTTVYPLVVLAFVFSVVYLTPFLIVGVYDRYLLPLFPISIILLGTNASVKVPKKIYQYIAYGCIGLFTLFSVCAVHDHLSWNRVRWKAIQEALDSGIPKNHINGGVEYVTWNFFSEDKEKWWESVKPVYFLVFKPADNQKVIKEYTYERWLPGDGVLFFVE
ncbi:glycosyltransferase family 39 protein [Kordia sp.]|uniref:glycosyltransferase family 39 protein n=1 Tax=Kordia sp. TaxID=1965332 RepID=UPI003D2DDCB9